MVMSIRPLIRHGRCEDLIPTLVNRSVALVVTSPPFALQRKRNYGGVRESDYPDWLSHIMELLRPKMKHNGSVLINLRPHIRHGQISDYVLQTRLRIGAAGWVEADELIWHAPDKPPLGRND